MEDKSTVKQCLVNLGTPVIIQESNNINPSNATPIRTMFQSAANVPRLDSDVSEALVLKIRLA